MTPAAVTALIYGVFLAMVFLALGFCIVTVLPPPPRRRRRDTVLARILRFSRGEE